MKIQGSLLGIDGEIIPFANVIEVGTNNTTTTDVDGKFTINVASAASQIKFSHAGYDYDTITAGEFNSYYELYPSELPGVTVYGTGKKDTTLLWILGGIAFIGVMAMIIHQAEPKKPTKVLA